VSDEFPSGRGRRPALTALAVLVWALAGATFLWLRRVAPEAIGFDFAVYLRAFRVATSGANPYAPYAIGEGFLNHPFLLTAVAPLAWLDDSVARWLWLALSATAWATCCWMVVELAGARPARFWLVILLGFAPAVEMLYVGQVNAFALLALLLAFVLARREQPIAAGALLALAIVLKATPAFLLLYFAAVRQWRVVGAALVGVALLTLLPAVQFGPGVLASYAETLARLSAEIHPRPLNLGLPALLARATGFLGLALPDAWLRGLPRAAVAGAALLLLGSFARRAPEPDRRLSLFAAFGALGTLASPLIWYHHLVFLLPGLGVLVADRSRRMAALGVSCLLAIQIERLWETAVDGFPLPAAVGMVGLTAGAIWLGLGPESSD
jgi:alpha-1,2-mannosyltransferase